MLLDRKIRPLLPAEDYCLTFIAHVPSNPELDIIVTQEVDGCYL